MAFTPDTSGCGECDGKVTELTLEYLGQVEHPAIQVVQKKDVSFR